MTDLEICVDGLVSDRIRDMNAMVEATRQELEKRYHADAEDLTMRTLKAAQINEDEYFGQILYDELAAILNRSKRHMGPIRPRRTAQRSSKRGSSLKMHRSLKVPRWKRR